MKKVTKLSSQICIFALASVTFIAGCASQEERTPAAISDEAASQDLSDEDGLEALAYSYALQAYLYTFPLTIVDREIKRREQITAPIGTAPIAPINRLGHMSILADAQSDMPYSPNNDTVYTGVALDLTAEPIILEMPEIKDRYAVVQVTNAYVENIPYAYSPTANGNDAAYLAFVGPDWTGELPPELTRVDIDTNMSFLAIRIALSGPEELPIVQSYQAQMSLTALSDWDGSPSDTPPTIPPKRERTSYSGPFAYFETAADLMAVYPPPNRHRAMNASLWRIGLEPGKPFDPDSLDPATRRGVERALRDGPVAIQYLRRNRGKRFPTGWDAGRYADNIVFDYAARAAMSLVGLMGNDPEEAIYFYTYFDADGEALNGSNTYRMRFEPGTLPKLNPLGFWSATMYDGETFRFIDNPIDRYRLGSSSNISWNDDGSLELWIQPDAPSEDKMKNWLPSPEGRPFRVTFRIYSPTPDVVEEFYAIDLALPPLEKTPN